MCFDLPNPVLYLESPGFERLCWAGVKPQTSLHRAGRWFRHITCCWGEGSQGEESRATAPLPQLAAGPVAAPGGAGLGGQGSCGVSGWVGVAPSAGPTLRSTSGSTSARAAPRAPALWQNMAAAWGARREAGRAPRIHGQRVAMPEAFVRHPWESLEALSLCPGCGWSPGRVKPELGFCLC